jgi:drug/metabolite transporter (DMT)-like permease
LPRLVYAALILLSLIWGGSFYFIKMLLHDFGPWSIAFLRSGSGLVVVVIIMLVLRKPFGFRTFPWLPMASILNATTPAWTIVVGILFFRSVSNRNQWLGLGMATIGLIVLVGITPGSVMSVNMLGFVCLLCASFCYGVGSQLSKRLLGGYSMYQITFGTLLTCMTVSGTMAFSTESVPLSHLASASVFPMVIGLGVFGSGFAYILFYYMIQKGSAEFATMVTYLVPCTALIWGYTLLNEKISWNLLVGLLIILAGVFLASRKPAPVKLAAAE